MPPRQSNAGSSTQRRRSGPTQTQRTQGPTTQTQRGRADDEESDAPGAGPKITHDSLKIDNCAKQLVRLALALHNTRTPLRRQSELVQKIMKDVPRQWKHVLEIAQKNLNDVFGMQLVELPVKEKVTLTQRRNAAAASGEASSSKAWILVSTLPDDYRLASEDIQVGGTEKEHAYMGFVTLIVSLIYLNSRMIDDKQLDKQLETFHMDVEHELLGKTSKLLEMMERQGYIMKVKENNGGETTVQYYVGPRGKTEIGEAGVIQLLKQMYPDQPPEELGQAFRISAGVDLHDKAEQNDDDDEPRTQRGRNSTQTGKKRSRRDQEDDDSD